MEIKVIVGACGGCMPTIFTINGQCASISDFGQMKDKKPDDLAPHSCGNMRFNPKRLTVSTLKRYNISRDDYKEVCSILKKELSVGACNLCD